MEKPNLRDPLVFLAQIAVATGLDLVKLWGRANLADSFLSYPDALVDAAFSALDRAETFRSTSSETMDRAEGWAISGAISVIRRRIEIGEGDVHALLHRLAECFTSPNATVVVTAIRHFEIFFPHYIPLVARQLEQVAENLNAPATPGPMTLRAFAFLALFLSNPRYADQESLRLAHDECVTAIGPWLEDGLVCIPEHLASAISALRSHMKMSNGKVTSHG